MILDFVQFLFQKFLTLIHARSYRYTIVNADVKLEMFKRLMDELLAKFNQLQSLLTQNVLRNISP